MASRAFASTLSPRPSLPDEFSTHVVTTRPSEPDDIAYAALYLARDESIYLNGTVIDVDSGTGDHYADRRAYTHGHAAAEGEGS